MVETYDWSLKLKIINNLRPITVLLFLFVFLVLPSFLPGPAPPVNDSNNSTMLANMSIASWVDNMTGFDTASTNHTDDAGLVNWTIGSRTVQRGSSPSIKTF